ncbi:MAG: hypothetical protein L0Z51_05785 [Candidatus Latescibacteria bacterium]|nr:hypothetical protein [Candidatus Latescibacterota bacterium]
MPFDSVRAAALALLAACALACAANGPSPPDSDSTPADSALAALEQACDAAVARVDELIALRDADPDFPRDLLAEARELRRAAVERFAAGDFPLALELLEAAALLLEDRAE